MGSDYKYHEPVLLSETLKNINTERLAHLQGTKVIDATLGFGGHTIALLRKGIDVLGIETDLETLKKAKTIIAEACPGSERNFGSVKIVNANFKDIDRIATENGFNEVDAVLFDLGVSTHQLTSVDRGFSFSNPDAVLDMRMDRSNQAVTAAMLINALDSTQLTNLFEKVLDYSTSRKLVRDVVASRKINPFVKVGDLLKIVGKRIYKSGKTNPATKVFMALRLAVNSEYENISLAIPKAFELLKPSGRLVVISFHSGEDGIIKEIFNNLAESGRAKKITKKPVVPTENEVVSNPRSRSAKLRCIEKI